MDEPSSAPERGESLRSRIIGLGERSFRKSYYPQLQQRLEEVEEKSAALLRTIDDLERTRRQLERSLLFNEGLLSALPTPVFYKDNEGRYLGCNRAFTEMLGLTPEQIRGKTAADLWAPEYAKVFAAADAAVVATGQRQVYEFKVRDRDGVAHPVIYVKGAFRDEDGHVAGVVGAFLDITERRQAEEALRKLNEDLDQRVKERTADLNEKTVALERANTRLEAVNRELEAFAYSVSHDLRAPLRSIDGFSKALEDDYAGILDAEARSYLQSVRSGARRMGQLIDDMLALSRIVRGEMRSETVDLSAIARDVAAELAAREAGRTVTMVVAPNLTATGDARFLRVALENLLGNAWKFTSRTPDPRIEFGATERDGRTVFHVRDNGAGFDMQYAGRLFRPFQRLHTADEFTGTGIGLATVQRVIQRHGGRVWAEGAVGQGATFYFSL